MLDSNITKKLTLNAKASLLRAAEIGRSQKSPTVEPEHLLLSIFFKRGSLGSNLLKDMGIREEALLKKIPAPEPESTPGTPPLKIEKVNFSKHLQAIVIQAYRHASQNRYPYVGTEHLVYALLESATPLIQEILNDAAKIIEDLPEMAMDSELITDSSPGMSRMFDFQEATFPGRTDSPSPTPFLDQFTLDVMEDVKRRKELIVGREKELSRIINVLGRKEKNNPLLIGDPGVGKTALVHGLAGKIMTGEAPISLINKKILSLDLGMLVAGTSYRGEFEARLKGIVRELSSRDDIIIFIDEIHTIVGAGNANGTLDAANMLKPALARGEIQCIGATTFDEYKKYIDKDAALVRRFQTISVPEPSPEESIRILRGIKSQYEEFHNVKITDAAISQAVSLSVRYLPERFLPDKSLDIIDEASTLARHNTPANKIVHDLKKSKMDLSAMLKEKTELIQREKYEEAIDARRKEKEIVQKIKRLKQKQALVEKAHPVTIDADDVILTVAHLTGVPIGKISTRQRSGIRGIARRLKSKIIGQEEAAEQIADTLYRSGSGVNNPERPMGSFLFLGPSGVGKTLAAQVLAQELFESDSNLVRIDMSEFMERHNVAQLIGAPAGYVGYGEGGKLTERVRRNPYSVVLFDEIEKAHPDVFNILLQILEDGTLTDAEGRKVNFRNTLIIITSNLGTDEFSSAARIGFRNQLTKDGLSDKFDDIKKIALEKLRNSLKPEILNRLDNVVIFNALGQKDIGKITGLELEKFKNRLKENGLSIKYAPEVAKLIARKSLSFKEGARLVRKNVRDFIETPVAKKIIENDIKKASLAVSVKKETVSIDILPEKKPTKSNRGKKQKRSSGRKSG